MQFKIEIQAGRQSWELGDWVAHGDRTHFSGQINWTRVVSRELHSETCPLQYMYVLYKGNYNPQLCHGQKGTRLRHGTLVQLLAWVQVQWTVVVMQDYWS